MYIYTYISRIHTPYRTQDTRVLQNRLAFLFFFSSFAFCWDRRVSVTHAKTVARAVPAGHNPCVWLRVHFADQNVKKHKK